MAAARKEATGTIENPTSDSVEERRRANNALYFQRMNEKVPINIPLNGEKIGTTTTASCDGVIYEIALGETVYVPRKVAEVIKRSIDGNIEVQKKIDKLAGSVSSLGEF